MTHPLFRELDIDRSQVMSERNGKKQTRTARAAKERGIKMARDQRREANRKTKQNKSPPSWVTDCN